MGKDPNGEQQQKVEAVGIVAVVLSDAYDHHDPSIAIAPRDVAQRALRALVAAGFRFVPRAGQNATHCEACGQPLGRAIDDNYAQIGSHHPATAKAAQEAVVGKTGEQRRIVMDAIAAAGDQGVTAAEAQVLFGKVGQPGRSSASARLSGLKDDKFIEDTGVRRPVPDTGHDAVAWTMTPLGRVRLAEARARDS